MATTPDWIEAIAAVFAAIGTVGAVWIALRQVRQQNRREMKLRCSLAVVPPRGTLVSLRGVNDGEKAIEVTMAYVESEDRHTIFSPFNTGVGDSLEGGKLVLPGHSVEVFWTQDELIQCRRDTGFGGYTVAYFVDTLGNAYRTTFPGATEKKVWRIRTQWPLLRRITIYTLPDSDPPTLSGRT